MNSSLRKFSHKLCVYFIFYCVFFTLFLTHKYLYKDLCVNKGYINKKTHNSNREGKLREANYFFGLTHNKNNSELHRKTLEVR